MNATDFQARFPKPWRFIEFGTVFSLRAANGAVVASLGLTAFHEGIPQSEWNRHVKAALLAYLPVEEESETERKARYAAKGFKAIR